MNAEHCRWGILGAAEIARKNWRAIRNAANATLVAVASRDQARSREFVAECQADTPFDAAPLVLDSYEALLGRDDVDAVYIPLPTGVRKEWVLRAARAGKHVLVEKPVGRDARDVVEMLDTCREHKVQLMDGVMFMHSQRFPAMKKVLGDGTSVGKIRRISTNFSFCASDEFFRDNIRTRSDLEPLGCLGDLGWYSIRFALWAMDWRLPETVSARALSQHKSEDSPAPVPTQFSAELFYSDDVSASLYCSFITHDWQIAEVAGTLGCLRVTDFVLPRFGSRLGFEVVKAKYNTKGCAFNMEDHTELHTIDEYSNGTPNSQEANMIHTFSDLARSGTPDPFWGRIALLTQIVSDACLQSAGANAARISVKKEMSDGH